MTKSRKVNTRSQHEQQDQPPKSETKKQPTSKRLKRSKVAKSILRQKTLAKFDKRTTQTHQNQYKSINFNTKDFIAMTSPEKFLCPICLELMIFPTISQCGHAFCLPCLEESLRHKSSCSMCRDPLTYEQFKQSNIISEILEKVITHSLKPEEKEEYEERVRVFLERDGERRVSREVSIGDNVDFYLEGVWEEGVVTGKREEQNGVFLTIQLAQGGEESRELNLNSRLLAKYHTYTKEKSLLQNIIGQFRFQISAFGQPLVIIHQTQVGLNQIEIFPIDFRRESFDSDGEIMRITFSFQPPEDN